jgi:hypothetical protein
MFTDFFGGIYRLQQAAGRACFLLGIHFWPRRWRQYVPPKNRWTSNGMHGVTPRKTSSSEWSLWESQIQHLEKKKFMYSSQIYQLLPSRVRTRNYSVGTRQSPDTRTPAAEITGILFYQRDFKIRQLIKGWGGNGQGPRAHYRQGFESLTWHYFYTALCVVSWAERPCKQSAEEDGAVVTLYICIRDVADWNLGRVTRGFPQSPRPFLKDSSLAGDYFKFARIRVRRPRVEPAGLHLLRNTLK